MGVTIDLALAKTHKFGSRDSGDSAELVERPGGGFSVVIVDGQGSGAGAKRLSLMMVGKTVALLNEGVRDGAAARAAHDFLFALRGGKVSAALDIVSVDLASRSVLFTRNSEVPMLVRRNGEFELITDSGGRLGVYRHTRPRVLEFPLEGGFASIQVSDGVANAGKRYGRPFDLLATGREVATRAASASEVADGLLQAALEADCGRPMDDMTVVALRLGPGVATHPIRRLSLSVPLPR